MRQIKNHKLPIFDKKLLIIAKRASVVIALFSFVIAPLLQFAPDGLWQIIRIFTGFYNIPVIAVVIVGLFTTRVPSIGPKIAIVFHIIFYGLFQFVFKDILQIHFLHLYAILFISEVLIMLIIGHIRPLSKPWVFNKKKVIDLTPWKKAFPVSVTLFTAVIVLYILFSPIGLVGGLTAKFWPIIILLTTINIIIWLYNTQGNNKLSVLGN